MKTNLVNYRVLFFIRTWYYFGDVALHEKKSKLYHGRGGGMWFGSIVAGVFLVAYAAALASYFTAFHLNIYTLKHTILYANYIFSITPTGLLLKYGSNSNGGGELAYRLLCLANYLSLFLSILIAMFLAPKEKELSSIKYSLNVSKNNVESMGNILIFSMILVLSMGIFAGTGLADTGRTKGFIDESIFLVLLQAFMFWAFSCLIRMYFCNKGLGNV